MSDLGVVVLGNTTLVDGDGKWLKEEHRSHVLVCNEDREEVVIKWQDVFMYLSCNI